MEVKKKIAVLGSTGSIGTQSLDVAEKQGFKVEALVAGRNIRLLEEQIRKFMPKKAAVTDEAAGKLLKTAVADTKTEITYGESAVISLAADNDADTVLNSIVGIAGLKPTLSAISAGKDIALANKETLVTAGVIVKAAVKEKGVRLLPVDSEHSAIFQCLQGVPAGSLKRILLTASGGPFFGKTAEELKKVTPADALKHPNWSMGAKITVDSATLMNKGLEVIEAVHLFNVSPDDITVVVQRQSIIHSAVELADGAVIAQLGVPDMRLPIQYALTFPARFPCPGGSLDLFKVAQLTFEQADRKTFRCLDAAIRAIKRGGLVPAAVNGANEEAVKLFLAGKLSFPDIAEVVLAALEAQPDIAEFSVDDVFAADSAARELARRFAK